MLKLDLTIPQDEPGTLESMFLILGRTVEAKEPYTQGHCERVARYAVALGRTLGLGPQHLTALHRGGYLHDLGKIAIPEAILNKRGKLNAEDWRVMQEHPVIGERICTPLTALKAVLPIIRHHHERWNGSGYPDGLKGQAIPLSARILQVADIYDALTTARPYRAALSQAAALGVLQEEAARGWRDARLVETLIELVQRGHQEVRHG